jgi:antitoxin MazE
MRTRVQKWGNSLAVRIPKAFAEGAGLRAAAEVELTLQEGRLQVVGVRPRWTLQELLSRVSKRNLHAEVDAGPRVGREIW